MGDLVRPRGIASSWTGGRCKMIVKVLCIFDHLRSSLGRDREVFGSGRARFSCVALGYVYIGMFKSSGGFLFGLVLGVWISQCSFLFFNEVSCRSLSPVQSRGCFFVCGHPLVTSLIYL